MVVHKPISYLISYFAGKKQITCISFNDTHITHELFPTKILLLVKLSFCKYLFKIILQEKYCVVVRVFIFHNSLYMSSLEVAKYPWSKI